MVDEAGVDKHAGLGIVVSRQIASEVHVNPRFKETFHFAPTTGAFNGLRRANMSAAKVSQIRGHPQALGDTGSWTYH